MLPEHVPLTPEVIRELIEISGHSLAEVGRRVGVSKGAVSNWQNGRNKTELKPEVVAALRRLGPRPERAAEYAAFLARLSARAPAALVTRAPAAASIGPVPPPVNIQVVAPLSSPARPRLLSRVGLLATYAAAAMGGLVCTSYQRPPVSTVMTLAMRTASMGERKGQPVPKAPLPGQARAPCPAATRTINGGCWIVAGDPANPSQTLHAPCPEGLFEYEGLCHVAVGGDGKPLPSSVRRAP